MKKLLAVAVILLFIGLAFAPSINANVTKASEGDKLVEITTEVCGLNGGKHTVSLTREDAEEVENLIGEVERRLDEVETRDEAVEIFNEAVVELDKYGLLGGLSVKQTQSLVTGGFKNRKILNFFEKLYNKHEESLNETENFMCLVAGNTNSTGWRTLMLYPISIVLLSLVPIYFFVIYLNVAYNGPILVRLLDFLDNMLSLGLDLWINLLILTHESNKQPFVILSHILYGFSKGWIFSIGLKGIKKINGKIGSLIPTRFEDVGVKRLGHICVFACEKNIKFAEIYEKNFGIKAHGDIRKISVDEIPKHDILCAGFPCQPFSKVGKQEGLGDVRNGGYFINDVVRILDYHKPECFILENVPHLRRHDREKTWKIVSTKLTKELDYHIKDAILSPHEFGIPQIRRRLFIVGSTKELDYFQFPKPKNVGDLDIRNIIDKCPKNITKLGERELNVINLWQKIIDSIPSSDKLPSFPIWSMEFGATYPFEEKTPFACTVEELSNYKGSFGEKIKGMTKEEQFNNLPSYARTEHKVFPTWKQNFIRQNRNFYEKYKTEFKPFISKLKEYPSSWQKLEWNCQGEPRILKKYIIQFRASGIRVKRTNYAPSLVLSLTHRPIIGWESRYITAYEGARLQSLESIMLPEDETSSFRALGNAVNSKIVYDIASRLLI